ncbi:MAG TPA: hypothetical protein VMC06_10630 [Opitutaceae bacterium]|nr:hypothetical protein [Opitutaceae bacterium]
MLRAAAGPAGANATTPRVFRLTYANQQPREEPKLFKCRDGIAFSEINAALCQAGYSYEMTINLYADDRRALTDGYPAFLPSDVIVQTMRPPLDDQSETNTESDARRIIPRNHGPLENEILDVVCRKYFAKCNRKFVTLSDRAKALFVSSEAQKHWGDLEFFENHQTGKKTGPGEKPDRRRYWAAVIKQHHVGLHQQVPPASNHTSTVAYLIRDQLPSIGCDVLVSFGMDGYCTLIWNHIVRRKYPDLITKKGFVMAELVFKELQDKDARPPISIAFADEIVDVNILAKADPIA